MYNGIREDISHTNTLTLSYDGNTINSVTLSLVTYRGNIISVPQSMETTNKYMWLNMDRNAIPILPMNINDIEDKYNYRINCPLNDTYKEYLDRIIRAISKLTYDYITPYEIIYVPDQETKDILKHELDKEGVKLEFVSDELDTVGQIKELDILKTLKPMNKPHDKNIEVIDAINNANNFHKYMLESMVIPSKKFEEARRLHKLKGDF